MRYIKILFIVLIIGLLSINVVAKEELREGPKLIIKNSSNEICIVMLYWINHPFLKETRGRPFNTVGAEMDIGETFNATYPMGIGRFYITVCKRNFFDPAITTRKDFEVRSTDKEVVILINKKSESSTFTITIVKDGKCRL